MGWSLRIESRCRWDFLPVQIGLGPTQPNVQLVLSSFHGVQWAGLGRTSWNLILSFFLLLFLFPPGLFGGWERMVSIVTVPPAGWSWVQTLVGTKNFSLLQDVQSSSEAHPAFYLMGTSVHYQDKSDQDMKLVTAVLLPQKLESSYTFASCICLHDVDRQNLTF